MSNQTYKKALNQLEKTEFLVVSVRSWKPSVNAGFSNGGNTGGSGGATPHAPDWNHVQDWCITELEGSAEDLRRADRDHRDLRVRLRQARLDRDRRLGELETGQRALRQSFSGTYGHESLALVGLDAEPARALLAAREQIREVVVRMRDPEMTTELPKPRAGQSAIALVPLADFWDDEITALEGKMAEIDELRKQAEEAMIARDEALKQSRRVYANAGRILEGLYRFAGLDELADRIRLTERSARRRAQSPATEDGEPVAEEREPIDKNDLPLAGRIDDRQADRPADRGLPLESRPTAAIRSDRLLR